MCPDEIHRQDYRMEKKVGEISWDTPIVDVLRNIRSQRQTIYSDRPTFLNKQKKSGKQWGKQLDNMNRCDIERFFCEILQNEEEISAGIAAIRTLMKVLENDESETVQGLHSNLQIAVGAMKTTEHPVTGVASGCELFMRFITLATLDTKTFAECKSIMLNRGKLFLKKLMQAKGKVAKLASSFIIDGYCVLTHSKSRVVLETLKEASQQNKRFEVYVTQSALDNTGKEMCNQLREANIMCTLILDSAVGYVMEKVDVVVVGAEGVVESGGIINKIGTYTMALCAKEMKKPFFVLTESFKFCRLYPLNQHDLPNEFKYTARTLGKDLSQEHPLVDYTPPAYINLLFTDLGILTPSAVSDELIKLYL